MIKIIMGGSPCTNWSIAQSKNRETEAKGIGWELFLNYLIAKERFQPDFFLYENNKSAAPAIKDQIARELGAPLQYINSALVSAQNRQRFYCHNFGEVPQPEDRGILLQDILEPRKDKARYRYTDRAKRITGANALYKLKKSLTHPHEKSKCLTCGQKATNAGATTVVYPDGELYIVSPIECCRLQTLPDDYCRAVSATQAYKGLGNGWTAEVVIHLLAHGLAGIPRDEPITVLSMYDGIGTGRYCLDRLGFKNITYYAYEIDKFAMQIALSNYPDIIQCGDAFQVREDDWFLRSAEAKGVAAT